MAPGVDVQAVAAANMEEAQMQVVLGHCGTARNLKRTFNFRSSGLTVTKLGVVEAVDVYICGFCGSSLKALLPKQIRHGYPAGFRESIMLLCDSIPLYKWHYN